MLNTGRAAHYCSSSEAPNKQRGNRAQVLRAEHEAGRGEVADARADRLATAKKVADAVAERDLARQMLKGVQAMLGHAEAARSSAQRALQQAQAEKAASQVCHPEHIPQPPHQQHPDLPNVHL